MKTSVNGIKLIQSFEKCRLVAYPDPKTGADPWTCGWGSTGADVKKGTVWTQAYADERFISDLAKFETAVSRLVTVELDQDQFDALVSFAYNCGQKNLQGSTLLRKLNSGDYDGAAAEFPRWINKGSPVEAGLLRRRTAERLLFSSNQEWEKFL